MEENFNKIFHILGSIEADQKSMRDDIKDIKDGVSDYRNFKNKLIGLTVGVSAAIGGGINVIIKKIGGL